MAESEVRQKFEASMEFVGFYFARDADDDYIHSDTYHAWLGYLAGMRAGEIARWIPVEEKLPPRHQDVLCYNRDGEIFQGRICVGMHKPFFTYPRGFGDPSNTAPDWINVTHWQPLPAAPEEKKP